MHSDKDMRNTSQTNFNLKFYFIFLIMHIQFYSLGLIKIYNVVLVSDVPKVIQV